MEEIASASQDMLTIQLESVQYAVISLMVSLSMVFVRFVLEAWSIMVTKGVHVQVVRSRRDYLVLVSVRETRFLTHKAIALLVEITRSYPTDNVCARQDILRVVVECVLFLVLLDNSHSWADVQFVLLILFSTLRSMDVFVQMGTIKITLDFVLKLSSEQLIVQMDSTLMRIKDVLLVQDHAKLVSQPLSVLLVQLLDIKSTLKDLVSLTVEMDSLLDLNNVILAIAILQDVLIVESNLDTLVPDNLQSAEHQDPLQILLQLHKFLQKLRLQKYHSHQLEKLPYISQEIPISTQTTCL